MLCYRIISHISSQHPAVGVLLAVHSAVDTFGMGDDIIAHLGGTAWITIFYELCGAGFSGITDSGRSVLMSLISPLNMS